MKKRQPKLKNTHSELLNLKTPRNVLFTENGGENTKRAEHDTKQGPSICSEINISKSLRKCNQQQKQL